MKRGDPERAALARGQYPVGIDEVGRGCIAGPVVTTAVVLDYDKLFALPDKSLHLIRDSKSLSARQRAGVLPAIESVALSIATASASVAEIDQAGILGATFIAMRRALASIEGHFDLILVDGNQEIPDPTKGDVAQQAIVKGDHWCFAIAAASIIAKESRDRFMQQIARKFPAYGFEKHVGYGTKEHIQNLKVHGITEWHRRGFEPVRSMCATQNCSVPG